MNAHVQAPASYTYGLAKPGDVKGLTGKQVLQGIIDGTFPQAPISQAMSFWIVEIGDGFAAFEGEPGPHVLNPRGTVHGGWALTLIDSATGCAVHTELQAGTGYTTVETKVNFTRAIAQDGGKVRCEGRVVTRGRQIATAEARLLAEDGKLLAHGTSTLIILPPRG